MSTKTYSSKIKYDIEKNQCEILKTLIDNKIEENISTSKNINRIIKNPKTNKEIQYDGDTTKELLKKCFIKYDDSSYIDLLIKLENMKKPKQKIINIKDIYDNIIKITDEIKKEEYLKNIFEETVYFKKDDNDGFNPFYIINSLKILYKNIHDDENKSLNEKSLKNVLNLYFLLLNRFFLKIPHDFNITLLFLNDYTKEGINENYNKEKEEIFNIPLILDDYRIYINTLIDDFENNDDFKIKTKINTLLNKIFYINIQKKNNKIYIKSKPPGTPKDYSKEYIIGNDNNELINKYIELFSIYNISFPKYHIINNISTKNKDTINDIVVLLTILNTFTHDLNEINFNPENKEEYNDIYKELIKYIDINRKKKDIHDINKLIYIIINNGYYYKKFISDYYKYYKYDGAFPYYSTLKIQDFLNVIKYQPINLDNNEKNIIDYNYKNKAPLYSKDLNIYLQSFITNDEIIPDDIYNRLNNIFIFKDKKMKDNYIEDTIYVFHGTFIQMHNNGNEEVNLTSFLSCSFNIYVALYYGKKYKTNCIIYIFKINNKIQYINLDDNLHQILLLPGTKILIKRI